MCYENMMFVPSEPVPELKPSDFIILEYYWAQDKGDDKEITKHRRRICKGYLPSTYILISLGLCLNIFYVTASSLRALLIKFIISVLLKIWRMSHNLQRYM